MYIYMYIGNYGGVSALVLISGHTASLWEAGRLQTNGAHRLVEFILVQFQLDSFQILLCLTRVPIPPPSTEDISQLGKRIEQKPKPAQLLLMPMVVTMCLQSAQQPTKHNPPLPIIEASVKPRPSKNVPNKA